MWTISAVRKYLIIEWMTERVNVLMNKQQYKNIFRRVLNMTKCLECGTFGSVVKRMTEVYNCAIIEQTEWMNEWVSE